MNIKKCKICEIKIIPKNEWHDKDSLFLHFCAGAQYLYFLEEDQSLYGIMSVKDYNLSCLKFFSPEAINSNFSFVKENSDSECEELEAYALFKKRSGIFELPILNEENKIQGVYIKLPNPIAQPICDWSLLNIELAKRYLHSIGIENIYCACSPIKLKTFNDFLQSLGIKLKPVSCLQDIDNLTKEDLFIYPNTMPSTIKCLPCSAVNTDELFGVLLGNQVVNHLKEKNVNYSFFQIPMTEKVVQSKVIKEKRTDKLSLTEFRQVEGLLDEIYGDSLSKNYIANGDYQVMRIIEKDNMFLLENAESETFNVVNNLRKTVGAPAIYSKTIYMFSTCVIRGYAVCDEKTIPSMIQAKLNQEGISDIRTVGIGTGGGLGYCSDIKDYYNILGTEFNNGDLVLHLGYLSYASCISNPAFDKYFELSWLFNGKLEKRCFLDKPPHATDYGNQIIADYIWSEISKWYL